jgi:hypothetical protein
MERLTMVTALRPNAELVTDFPEDQVEQGAEIVRQGGLAVTRAIAEILTELGLSVSSPINAGDHGWELEAVATGVAVWFQISDLGEVFLVQTRGNTSIRDTAITPGRLTYASVLLGLNEGIRRHPRFSRISWHDAACDGKGWDAPLDVAPEVLDALRSGEGPRRTQVPPPNPSAAPGAAKTGEIRPCAEFVGDFPKDLVEDGYTLVRPNGLAATTAISDVLAGLGLSVLKPVTTLDFGWQIDARGKGLKVLFQVNDYDATFMLLSREITPAWQRVLMRQPVSYAALLTKLNDALRRHPKISQLVWHARPYDGKGMETPVDDAG